jgi:DNA polymerase-1
MELQKSELKENNQMYLLERIEQPLAVVISEMEKLGIKINTDGMKKYSGELAKKISDLQEKIYDVTGVEFNINSPKQLGYIIFEQLKLAKGKKNKSGYSTKAEVLENLRGEHPAINLILEYRMLSKLKSTFCDGILKAVREDARVYSVFNQTETRTGRISSLEPNLQNIPARTKAGRRLRKYFCAKSGCVLVDADYSQIELRVLAHLSEDENMINSFAADEDIHSAAAAKIFGISAEEVDEQKRNLAKTVNFGIIYGMSAFSLAKELKISRLEAQEYIYNYFDYYSGVFSYMKNTIKKAMEEGYVKTIFDRRRYLPELRNPNHNVRAFGERVARNMPIQGSAADIIKIAMINTHRCLVRERLEARLILQVHDELIIECPEKEVFIVKKMLAEEMEQAVHLRVPLKVNIGAGDNWYNAKT